MLQKYFGKNPNRGRLQYRSNTAFTIVSKISTATLLVFGLGLSALQVQAEEIGPLNARQRAAEAYKLRVATAVQNLIQPLPAHPDNQDEARYANQLNSYTKGLPHDANGLVDPAAYAALLHALRTGENADFEAIPMGIGQVKFRNPLAAYSYFMEGKDSHSYTMPAAPAFSSAWQASEAIEVMWQALTRDVPFIHYDSDGLIRDAAADLARFSDFRGPKDSAGKVTAGTLFRGVGAGETVGPYISQFLLKPIPYGATTIEQKYEVPVAGNDHLTNFSEWLRIQNGGKPTGITKVVYENEPRYLYNGRALAQYVLKDFINMAYMNAAQIMRSFKGDVYSATNPYRNSLTQTSGPLFDNNHAVDFLSRVSMGSQNVAWFQKWLVHRRARPEVFFARVHMHLMDNGISYPIHPELLASSALSKVYVAHGTYLLPTATPDGSPTHPSYPAGHAVMAGAAVTMLKVMFNGDFVIPDPVQPSADGMTLESYQGATLTVNGELNKLASNISLGRDTAGVHYRSDGDLGLVLGEAYAISILQELVNTYSEEFTGFTFKRFDGTPVLISKQK